MIPRSYVSEENFKLLLEQYGLFYSVKEGLDVYLLTNVVEGLNKDGKLDAFPPFHYWLYRKFWWMPKFMVT